MYTKYPNRCNWISKLMIVYWPVLCKIVFTGLYYWNLLYLSVIWRTHTYSSHIYWIKSRKQSSHFCPCSNTGAYDIDSILSRNCLPFRSTWVHPGFSGVSVTRSLVLYVCFVCHFLSFCTFSFGHCVVCSSLTYRLWLPLWYLQTLLTYENPSQP
jgi:hypothetical protein